MERENERHVRSSGRTPDVQTSPHVCKRVTFSEHLSRRAVHISHRRTTPTHDTCRATQPHLTQILRVCKYFRYQDGPVSTGTFFSIKKWQPRQQEDRDHAGRATVDEAVVVPLKDADSQTDRRIDSMVQV